MLPNAGWERSVAPGRLEQDNVGPAEVILSFPTGGRVPSDVAKSGGAGPTGDVPAATSSSSDRPYHCCDKNSAE